ncbi:MAG: DALR anticodon-binding domain-containing protein, partial [Selenomonadaceae bacterium]
GKDSMAKSIQAFVRVGNLAKNSASAQVNPALFVAPEETALYQAYTSAAAALESLIDGSDFTGALDAISDLAAPIDAFFAAVMVMDKQEAVKNNRLGLLKAITELVGQIADFSKIVQA